MKKSERLNQELIFLSDKKRFNLQDLMDNFQISKRTALRDIASLEELGLALYAEAGRAGGYSLIQEDLLTKIYFNSDEVAAIFFALKAMEQLKETPFNESFQMISQKLLKNLAASRQQQALASQAAVSFFNTPAVHHNPYLRLLMESILHDSLVRANFKGQQVLLQPCQLFFRDGNWLFAAYDLVGQAFWNYRCDQLQDCTEQAAVPNKLSLAELKQKQLEFEHDNSGQEFKILLNHRGQEHFLKNLYPNMQLEHEGGTTYLTGSYTPRTFEYLIDYLLTFGLNAKIITPEELRRSFKERLAAILDQYS
ncbi:WYL domain-containing protein [Lactobacillus delbrueckii subsp. lactis]|uniref:WYL domain-containing protein n=1 Tax=Lactobacillus delbrueckii subsp. lactis TaxID=29397 RepID=A0ABD4SJ06_LACDL|nr:WYL domain-containing protein [Lactobacillus delbrueckii]EPB99242.1 deoR-like helix-turn-helix domain protein [Lactobacillus delbrueckii subsp. lactis CRL581]MCD5443002.1 WYL domain-containing protein [Lactobacillus delbrueckii subsp. lactis]MCD5445758.1 WYL domain-containing protein [Lactobacillus delbrueckii subsp. lactis]MCD5493711.1 WYL domain-containing protein [Lactobacillus delbrueckii subsp. lactis]MCD5501125.1 WYL domain-containing protein [Lactobacillus delbrueckii subsp. lactis]